MATHQKNLIIVGAGGLGLEVAAYAEDAVRAGKAPYVIKGFLDDTKPVGAPHASYPVLGSTKSPVDPEVLYVIAVGKPEGRRKLAEALAAHGAHFTSIRHPQSYGTAGVEIGEGSVIAPFAFVGPAAKIGVHCLLNVYALAGHECRIDDYCVLSPHVSVQGRAALGRDTFVGDHACITAGIKIGARATIASGAVVYNDIPADTISMGNPAAHRLKI